ncbi:MAG: hypothetical protein PHC64_04910 [Candidatus Gastranaerophilales bacterium]|nr:hypothetical protein [Candidatus Gastranaerophilales bacterium]
MEKEIDDFLVDIIQNFNEIYSILRVLKDSLNNENSEIIFNDIENTLEIIISKVYNTRISLDKYVEMVA